MATRLAKALLEQHCDENQFEVDLLSEEDTPALVDALKAEGCLVTRRSRQTLLKVICADATVKA